MGLLDSVIEAAKQQYQTTKRGFGLLASNPQQFAQEATTRYFPTKEEEAQFAQAQAAGGDYTQTPYYQKIFDLSQFAAPTVYHGTPHLFPPTSSNVLGEFNPLKIGSGEGNQMYGYGHYLGGAEGTGQKYKKDVSSDFLSTASGQLFDPNSLSHINIRSQLRRNPENLNEIILNAQQIANSNSGAANYAKSDLNKLLELQKSGGVNKHSGYLYTVDLPDSSARRMLDYDKELKNQPKLIRNLATKYGVDLNDIGFDLIQKIGNDVKGSEVMRNAGIPGIKYLDEGSRGNFMAQTTYKGNPYGDVVNFKTKKQLDDYIVEKSKEGFGVKTIPQTSNYVVFPQNEGLLTIKSRNK